MRKIMALLLIITFAGVLTTGCKLKSANSEAGKSNISVQNVVDKINTKKDVHATVNDKTIDLVYVPDTKFNITFDINGNILRAKLKNSEDMMGTYLVSTLVDAVGELYGYKKGDSAYSFNTNKTSTIEKDGWAVSEKELSFTIDISKKPIFKTDLSDVYFKVEDFVKKENDNMAISESASLSTTNYGLKLEKYPNGFEYVISENGGLTNRTYNSILNLAQAISGSDKAPNYIKANYPQFKDKQAVKFPGVIIECNVVDDTLLSDDQAYKIRNLSRDFEDAKSLLGQEVNNYGSVIIIFDKNELLSAINK